MPHFEDAKTKLGHYRIVRNGSASRKPAHCEVAEASWNDLNRWRAARQVYRPSPQHLSLDNYHG